MSKKIITSKPIKIALSLWIIKQTLKNLDLSELSSDPIKNILRIIKKILKLEKIINSNKNLSDEIKISSDDNKEEVTSKLQKLLSNALKTDVKVKINDNKPININLPNPITLGKKGSTKCWNFIKNKISDQSDQKIDSLTKSLLKEIKEVDEIIEFDEDLQDVIDEYKDKYL